MKWCYRCPQCSAMLNPDESVIVVAEHNDSKMLASFHPQPGNYFIAFPPEAALEKGQKWIFSCPVCGESFSKGEEEMCKLQLFQGEVQSEILFSRIAGKQATFIVDATDGKITHQYGSDAADMFYNLSMMS